MYGQIRYLIDGKREIINLEELPAFQEENWKKEKVFLYQTGRFTDNGREEMYSVHVLQFAPTEEALRAKISGKRVSVPKRNFLEAEAEAPFVDPVREKCQGRAAHRRKVLLASTDTDREILDGGKKKTADAQCGCVRGGVTFADVVRERDELKKVILEKTEIIAAMEAKFRKEKEDWEEERRRFSDVAVEVRELKDVLMRERAPVSSSSRPITNGSLKDVAVGQSVAGKVFLGGEVFCSEAAWADARVATSAAKWVASVLVGVFGQAIKVMRLKPSQGQRRFPDSDLKIIEGHYGAYLAETVVEDGERVRQLKLFRQHISTRTNNSGGRRGKGAMKDKTNSESDGGAEGIVEAAPIKLKN